MMEEMFTREFVAIMAVTFTFGWIVTTWLRVKHGYPLANSWGKSEYPIGTEAEERVKLVSQENAQLRAQIGSLQDRLGNVERIVTDSGYQLTSEIEQLRDQREAN